MGTLDLADFFELVGLFVLYKLTAYDDININSIGLYIEKIPQKLKLTK